ncbi:MAG TPA: ubiquitin-like domain-containing protein [Bellilinea sp.]|nr:ubiquitin-like domain-containing protein [Bellilinea sp.]
MTAKRHRGFAQKSEESIGYSDWNEESILQLYSPQMKFRLLILPLLLALTLATPAAAQTSAPPYSLTLTEDGATRTLQSSAPTLLAALWEAGIEVRLADELSPPADTPLTADLAITLTRAAPLTVTADGQALTILSAKPTVGEALAQAAIPLQAQDYTVPAADQPIPADRNIRIVRVQQSFELTQNPLPFESTYQEDPNGELDTRTVITPGLVGIEVTRTDLRLEDGQEVSRTQSGTWIAREPQGQILGYGIKPVTKTIDTPAGPMEYWRAVNVYATAYSPCRIGIPGKCSYGTSSGLPVQQGTIAVTRAWYSWMKGQRVYIPGYGIATIGDVGGGIPGRYWIDLAYTDDTYQSWASNVTMYFLAPIPPSIPYILP